MGMVFDKLKSQIEDLLFQWEQKEASHVATIHALEAEVEQLRLRLTEAEDVVKRLTADNEKLGFELGLARAEAEEVRSVSGGKRSWKRMFMF